MQVDEEQMQRDLLIAGEDPFDPLARALYTEALAASQPIDPKPGAGTFTSRLCAASKLTHREIGDMIGVSRATVQAYGSGRIKESYHPEELAVLRPVLDAQLVKLQAVIDEVARMQAAGLH